VGGWLPVHTGGQWEDSNSAARTNGDGDWCGIAWHVWNVVDHASGSPLRHVVDLPHNISSSLCRCLNLHTICRQESPLNRTSAMKLSTSSFIATRTPSSSRQIEAQIESGRFGVEKHAKGRKGRVSGIDIRGLDLAYRPSEPRYHFDSPDTLCSVCSEFTWLRHASSEQLYPSVVYLGPLRQVLSRGLRCRLCRVVLQSIKLSYGVFDDFLPVGLAVCVVPRGKALFDVTLNRVSRSDLPTELLTPDLPPHRSFRLDIDSQGQPRGGSRLWKRVTSSGTPQIIKLFDIRRLCAVTVPESTPYLALRYNVTGTYSSTYNWGWFAPSKNPDYSARWVHLPLSVKHAIALTERLGHRYLWVDWLCASPCPGSPDENGEQLAQLPEIFARASFTIAASAGQDEADHGVLGVYKTPELSLLGAKFGEWTVRPCLSYTVDRPKNRRVVEPRAVIANTHPYRPLAHEWDTQRWERRTNWTYRTLVLCHKEDLIPIAIPGVWNGCSGTTAGARALSRTWKDVIQAARQFGDMAWCPHRVVDVGLETKGWEDDTSSLVDEKDQ